MYTPEIVFEDNHLLIVNKPFGMPSQGDSSGDLCVFDWAKEYIRETYNKPGNVYVALLHRLDRPTGGLIALAKTSKAASRMSSAFQNREVVKTYFAITERAPEVEADRLTHYVKKLPDKNIMRAYIKEVHGTKKAVLTYEVVQKQGQRALIKVNPLTGRRHQIRVQLASLKSTIVGDVKYGKTDFNPDKSIALFAQKLAFIHPVKKEPMEVVAPWPKTPWWQEFQMS